ncbi:hypothetical protein [Candidatus Uabimicrobium sp. HlEnr_7]|uniref:hypothetical protein n=1 Tax=Candidatus Uabimicrobium helgolandensis TaxID=3095367 RepID=UPI0035588C4E
MTPPHTPFEDLIKNLLKDQKTNRKSVLIHSLNLLREVCTLHEEDNSKFANEAIQAIRTIDNILVATTEVQIDAISIKHAKEIEIPQNISVDTITLSESAITFYEESDEDFLQSASQESQVTKAIENTGEIEIDSWPQDNGQLGGMDHTEETLLETQDTIEIESKNSYEYLSERWNKKVDKWFFIHLSEKEEIEQQLTSFVLRATDVRSNLASASLSIKSLKEKLRRFDRYWKMLQEQAYQDSYEIFPQKYGRIPEAQGKVIYSFRPKAKSRENILIRPGLRKDDREIVTPITLVTLPKEGDLPEDYQDQDLPPHWCGILGEVDILLSYLDIQQNVYCSIETVNKGSVQPLQSCRENVITEIKRRREALKNAIRSEETIYRIATNYWRIEECFWSIFHDDGRPKGYSFFDRLRRRLQSWRAYIRKENNIFVRDFSANNDTLTSINKYVGNVIFQNKRDVAPGTVLREIRPAVIVKVNKVTRLLKGRVVST